ncbi:hypothetical protein, partial [Mycobacteroides abscessus]|uniref:hypothetical protein n=1 Tax=Mycobacteroides abscessus TaxID=36809 RepID=UPI001E355B2B
FEGPLVSVDVWLVTVLGAAVPEAAADEDPDLSSSECDSRPDQPAIDQDGAILPATVSESMKSLAEFHFRFGVFPADHGHVAFPARRGDVNP